MHSESKNCDTCLVLDSGKLLSEKVICYMVLLVKHLVYKIFEILDLRCKYTKFLKFRTLDAGNLSMVIPRQHISESKQMTQRGEVNP